MDAYDVEYTLQEILHKNNFGFKIDWKWAPEDILYNMKNTVAHLSYSLTTKLIDKNTKEDLTHKDMRDYNIENSEWEIKGIVNNAKITVNVPFDQPTEFINYLNPLLEKRWKGKFIEHVSAEDEYAYSLKQV